MTINRKACDAEHSHLLSGKCPWCGTTIEFGQPSVSAAVNSESLTRLQLDQILRLIDDGTDHQRLAIALGLKNRSFRESLLLCRGLFQKTRLEIIHFCAAIHLAIASTSLNRDDVVVTREYLQLHADDVASRIVLANCPLNPLEGDYRLDQMKWIIMNYPELAVEPISGMVANQREYENVRECWLKVVGSNPKSSPILRNAVIFFSQYDLGIAERLKDTATATGHDDETISELTTLLNDKKKNPPKSPADGLFVAEGLSSLSSTFRVISGKN